ncbi:unnamed protein product [Didymodactylos carnosus]|uniref:EGF-like domain-containing protein n=1 Tax=Didymodactylos carnosus TaxID=1234261 RepID=A0A816EQ80_9BILA|nr:unnamed protein product [Didymodactylos carnosus]CAF4593977.1 unnamed protein product [Didymodactylos carnosus]
MGWQLIPYCIRRPISNEIDDIRKNSTLCYGTLYSFRQLKSFNIISQNLFDWYASNDIINDYEKYLSQHTVSNSEQLFCNCSDGWFGTQCQYRILSDDKGESFDNIITQQFALKPTFAYMKRIEVDEKNISLTCYIGLQCNSTLCLDWRQICDGIVDCEQAEDEQNYTKLELNVCDTKTEFRCKNNQCSIIMILGDSKNNKI